MKIVWLVVAFALGALLVYFLTPLRKAPAIPAPEKETRDAAVVVELVGANCRPRTYSSIIDARAGDDLLWRTVAVGECADYVADLQIAVKNSAHEGDLEITDSTPGPERRATVPRYPERCLHQPPPCRVPYRVVVTSTDPDRPPQAEDPRVDIWP
jgi:hypothetical protein